LFFNKENIRFNFYHKQNIRYHTFFLDKGASLDIIKNKGREITRHRGLDQNPRKTTKGKCICFIKKFKRKIQRDKTKGRKKEYTANKRSKP
jgi:hypothetical protein